MTNWAWTCFTTWLFRSLREMVLQVAAVLILLPFLLYFLFHCL
jgi:hypothetical protein